MFPAQQNHAPQSDVFLDSDITLIAYLAIRSKAIPEVLMYADPSGEDKNKATKITFFPDKAGTKARLIMLPTLKVAVLHSSDKPGLDPFWSPSPMRLSELRAVLQQAGYSFNHHLAWDHSDINSLHARYLVYKEEVGICRALRKTAQATGITNKEQLRILFLNVGIPFEPSTFDCQISDFLKTGRTDTSDH